MTTSRAALSIAMPPIASSAVPLQVVAAPATAPPTALDGYVGVSGSVSAADKNAIARITASPFWATADAATRHELWAVARACPAETRGAMRGESVRSLPLLAELAERGVLADKAHDGRTLLQILVHAPLDAKVGAAAPISAAMLPVCILVELAHPGIVTQGMARSCTVTSMQLALIRTNPAEYARLVAGLFAAGVVPLRDGQALRFDANSSHPYDGDPRLPTSRAFQSALMQFSHPELDYAGGSAPASFVGPRSLSRLPHWLQVLAWLIAPVGLLLWLSRQQSDGLEDAVWLKTASALFGRTYIETDSHGGALRARWLMQFIARGQPVLAGVYWREQGQGHELEVVSVVGERVIMRDPSAPYNGIDFDRSAGAPIPTRPGMMMVDAAQGLVSCTLGDPRFDLTFGVPKPEAKADERP